jgi:hypothetical protein
MDGRAAALQRWAAGGRRRLATAITVKCDIIACSSNLLSQIKFFLATSFNSLLCVAAIRA